MFDIGWGELVVIGIVALIAIGPKELPGVLRMVGQWMGKVRRMAAEFQGQFQEAMREAEMADLKKQVEEIGTSASDLTHFDPLEPVRSEFDDLNKTLEEHRFDDDHTTAASGPVEPVPGVAELPAPPAELAPPAEHPAATGTAPHEPPMPKSAAGG